MFVHPSGSSKYWIFIFCRARHHQTIEQDSLGMTRFSNFAQATTLLIFTINSSIRY